MNALLEELKNTSVMLQTHWDETRNMWDDCVRDRVEKIFIETYRDTIQLCLQGQSGSTHVWGRGLFELFAFIEEAARTLSRYSGEKTTFDATGENSRTIRYSDENVHRKRYDDEAEENMMIDYDEEQKRL